MIVIRNNLVPFRGFAAMNFCGLILFVRNGVALTDRIMNHERIHSRQMFEMLIVFFYIWYGLEWIVKAFKHGLNGAYMELSFEREAYRHDWDLEYLEKRKLFNWLNYL